MEEEREEEEEASYDQSRLVPTYLLTCREGGRDGCHDTNSTGTGIATCCLKVGVK